MGGRQLLASGLFRALAIVESIHATESVRFLPRK
jgi:hypothetical protein